MKACVSCSLPAPQLSEKCAYCGQSFDAPSTFELKATPTTFSWQTHGTELAEARIEDGIWRLYRGSQPKPFISMLAIRRDDSFTAALLDQDLIKIATVVVRVEEGVTKNSKRYLGVVNDDTQTMVVIHGDGPTGYHFVNRLGDVLALASPRYGGALAGLDVLVTNAGYPWRPLEFFATLLALVLARVSSGSCDFSDIDHLCLDNTDDYQGSDPNEA